MPPVFPSVRLVEIMYRVHKILCLDVYRDKVTYRECMTYTMDSDLYRDEVTSGSV